MTKLLQDAIDRVRTLPAAEQDAIAADVMERVADYGDVRLTVEQKAEVARRLAQPAQYVSKERMHAFFARFGIGA